MLNEFWQKLGGWLKPIADVFNFSALMILQIGAIVAASYFAGNYLKERVACEWGQILIPSVCPKLRTSSSTETIALIATISPRIALVDWNDTKQLINRANEQFETIQLRKRFHIEIVMGFYKAYSWSILAVLFAAPFAAVAVVLLGQGGLSAASMALKATFFATTITASVAAAIPSIFGHQSSISANQALFLAYEDLGNQMKTFYDSGHRGATKELVPATASASKTAVESCIGNCLPKVAEIRNVLGHIDEEMKRLNQIAIAIDSSKIPAFTINTGKN